MKKADAEALCRRWLPLWTDNRPEELAAIYSEDAFYRDPAIPNGIRGREALLAYFRKLLAVHPNWRWYAEEIIETPKGFTLKWHAEIPVGDQVIEEYGLDIVEVNNQGLASRNEVFFDRTTLMETMGFNWEK